MNLRALQIVTIFVLSSISFTVFSSADNNSPQTLFGISKTDWIRLDSSSELINSYSDPVGMVKLHIGVKPFFHTIVPHPSELYRSLFDQIATQVTIDWESLKLHPEDRRLHKPQLIKLNKEVEVALSVLPILESGVKHNYAIASFLQYNYPVYIIHTKIQDQQAFITYLKSLPFFNVQN